LANEFAASGRNFQSGSTRNISRFRNVKVGHHSQRTLPTPVLSGISAIAIMDRGFATASITVIDQKSLFNGSTPNSIGLSHPKLAKPVFPIPHNAEQVRIVPPEEYKQAALCLAEAFKEDEVARYFIDTPDRTHWTEQQKWDLHCDILEYITYAHCLKGLVTAVGPNYDAVALW